MNDKDFVCKGCGHTESKVGRIGYSGCHKVNRLGSRLLRWEH